MPAASLSRFALAAPLCSLLALAACGGATSAAAPAAAPAAASAAVRQPAATAVQPLPGKWAAAAAGQMLDVALGDLHPTQAALGYDQIYYKLGRYERDPLRKFDDFCADEGLGGLRKNGASPRSTLTNAASYACTTTDPRQRDTSVLNPVVVGPNGDTLYLTDGHHGLSTYYEVPGGGPTLHVHVLVKDNLSGYSGSAFWAQMQRRGYTRLKDANGAAITPAQLPTGLGLELGMQDDVYRSLVYFTRGIGYRKPTSPTDFLEFYWADWLRARFPLSGYTLAKLGATAPDPATADTGYLNAIWNASRRMVGAADPVIDGKTGADLGRLARVNAGRQYTTGAFGELSAPLTAAKPGKLAYALAYKARHGLP
ncbi:ParB/Srx family N-terminal domain-containing protein [Burkholderia glumae]|uniref:ParB/Srx family N-terminal domain-containing protein n=1 Tax=Burkholderia glumae TaxID=337 RepID=UPI0020375676|nr:ParB/Srx family N-terminal domain-containing protein [Burkholderia glumae]MCM2549848.1 ParB/Srx family N-terminal domain-containing protein [Burkholderia glumae]